MAATAPLLRESERFGYLKPKDVARLEEAYRFSEAAHAGQTRQSGEPYISHPLEPLVLVVLVTECGGRQLVLEPLVLVVLVTECVGRQRVLQQGRLGCVRQ